MNTRDSILKLWVCVGILLVGTYTAMGQEDASDDLAKVVGEVVSVTVYRDKALVTREMSVDATGGDMDFIVTGLPDHIVSSSLYATAEGAMVQGVTYFVDETVEAAAAPELPDDMQNKLEELQLSIQINNQKMQVITQEEAYLQQLQGASTTMPNAFSTTTRDPDTDAEVVAFAPEQAMEMFEYMFEKRAELGERKIKLMSESTALSRETQDLQKEIVEFHKDNPATGQEFDRRALVSLTGTSDGEVTIKLHYLVQNVRWSPTYTARATTGNHTIQLDYNAFVLQQTGEDWTGVKLTLSTASPDMWSEPPILKPLWMDLTDYDPANYGGNNKLYWVTSATGVGQDIGSASQAHPSSLPVQNDKASIQRALDAQVNVRQSTNAAPAMSIAGAYLEDMDTSVDSGGRVYSQMVVRKQVAQYDESINELANRLQTWDIVVGDGNGNGVSTPAPKGNETISLEYALPGEVSIPSRPEQMMVKVDQLELSGEVTYIAVPLLTDEVFREAELENTSTIALLPGPINSYLDGRFVGSGDLESLVSQGEEFALGFGVDSQLEAHRRLVEREEGESWGKTRLTCEYEISLTNYKDVPVTVLVKDRLPNVEDTEIELASFNTSEALVTDAYFVEYLKPLGMLRWNVDIPASAERADVKTLTYDYTLQFDKDKHITLPTPAESRKRERDAIMAEPAMMMNRNW